MSKKVAGVTEPLTRENVTEEVEAVVRKEMGRKDLRKADKVLVEKTVESIMNSVEKKEALQELSRENPFRDPDSGAKLPEVLTDYSAVINNKHNSNKGKGTGHAGKRKSNGKIGDAERLRFMENYLICRGSVEAAAYQTGISVGKGWQIMQEPEMKKVREEVNLRILDRLFQRMVDEAERNPLMMIFLAKALDRKTYDDHYARRLLEYKLQRKLQKDLLNVSKELPGQILLVPEAKPERISQKDPIAERMQGQFMTHYNEGLSEKRKIEAANKESAAERYERLKAEKKDPFE